MAREETRSDCSRAFYKLQNTLDFRLRRVCAGNGIIKAAVHHYAQQEGIEEEPSVARHLWQATTVVPNNRTIFETTTAQIQDTNPPSSRTQILIGQTREFLHNATMPAALSPFAMQLVVWKKSRLPTEAPERKTPWEVFKKEKPDLSNDHPFGASVYVPSPEEVRALKLDAPRG